MQGDPEADLARSLVADTAPDELPFFVPMLQAYRADPKAAQVRSGRDDILGFGMTEVATLMTPVILAITTQVRDELVNELAKPLTHAAAETIKVRVLKLFRRDPDADTLNAQQLSRIREIAIQVGLAQGLPQSSVAPIADKLIERLSPA